ncbi:GxxExxY protein [Reichenbachiella sp. 5M10]|uniref:GxxExxY protein n=1 Tax=Reichenbachiella sp. 5M10 TaxID=1889772 RepID=UPI0035161E46
MKNRMSLMGSCLDAKLDVDMLVKRLLVVQIKAYQVFRNMRQRQLTRFVKCTVDFRRQFFGIVGTRHGCQLSPQPLMDGLTQVSS